MHTRKINDFTENWNFMSKFMPFYTLYAAVYANFNTLTIIITVLNVYLWKS